MNSNGSQFHLLNSAEDFRTDSRDRCLWNAQNQALQLLGAQSGRFAGRPLPNALAASVTDGPMVLDPHGFLGFIDHSRTGFVYTAAQTPQDGEPVTAGAESNFAQTLEDLVLEPVTAPPGTVFDDLHLGGDGRAALPYSDAITQHGLKLVHLARRWQTHCELQQQALRVCVDHLNRVWAAGEDWLSLCTGEPLPRAYVAHPAERFEPEAINPHPLEESWSQPLPASGSLVALCCDRQRVYLLTWQADDSARGFVQHVLSRSLDDDEQAVFHQHNLPPDLPFATDIAALQDDRIALMLPVRADAADKMDLPVLEIPQQSGKAYLLPERYPRHSQRRARFISAIDGAVRYLSDNGPKPLHRLPQARFLAQGRATLNRVLDSGTPDTLWHKIYLDACIPSGCDLRIQVKAFEEYDDSGDDWQEQQQPHWLSSESEIAFQSAFFKPTPGHQGLFEILLQREDGEVREVRGRYLRIAVEMRGDGRHSPAIHAMRVYYPRLSWQQAYLPQHFHQQQRPDPDQKGRSGNGADLRERMLAVAEGLMTPIEDKIAHAEYWAYPRACPSDHLPRLAALLGAELPSHWPEYRQREWLACYGWITAHRGTLDGLRLALDIATDGAVTRGQVVPVENYRLRRTLATILGLEMDDADHPLTLGTGQSGNSLVGNTLILSEDDAKAFLALFAPQFADTAAEREAVDAFFDKYAYQLSVVLHGPARAQRHTVERVLQRETPAHLQWKLLETDHPFVLGLSPLLGIDTYLQNQPAWRQVELNDTHLTSEGLISNPVALSPNAVDGNPSSNRGEA